MLIAAALVLAYGWWATALPPFALASTVAVVGAGVAAMVVGSRYRRPPAEARPRVADVAIMVVLLGALAAWQLAAYLQHPRNQHPTLSSLTNMALDAHPVRALAFTVWLLGAALLARR